MKISVKINTIAFGIMTLSRTSTEELTKEEWEELNALREAISEYPQSVHPDRQERFTELFVKSLEGKADRALV
jgi:hypothetical protein